MIQYNKESKSRVNLYDNLYDTIKKTNLVLTCMIQLNLVLTCMIQ